MRAFHAALLFLWAILLVPLARAQDEEFPVPPAPGNGVFDEARLFAREPQRLEAIAASLDALEAKHGFRLYFAIYDTLIGRSIEEQAAALQKKWLAGKPGMVLVLEADSRRWRYSEAAPIVEKLAPGNIVKGSSPSDLSPLELKKIDGELEAALLAVAKDPQAFAETLGTGVAGKASEILDQRAAVSAGGNRLRITLLAIGLLALTGLVALLVVAGIKRAEAKSRERYAFPKVAVSMRLGAPYGGGKVSTREFGGSK